MSTLIITVGVPGCGKSTWATKQGYEVVSSDAIREELCGDPTDQTRNREVFDTFHERIAEALRNHEVVVADSTALDGFARKKLRKIARDENARTILAYWPDTATARKQNRQRDRVVPEDVMDRMMNKLGAFLIELEGEACFYDLVKEI